MRVLFDTNVLVDIFTRREPFFSDSYRAFFSALDNGDSVFITTCTITDMMYILRREFSSKSVQKAAIHTFISGLNIVDVSASDTEFAFLGAMDDFEDAVQASCALKAAADCIVTRNVMDFARSPVPAVKPATFSRAASGGAL